MEHELLTGRIIGAAMQVHTVLRGGYLEAVYQQALAHELRRRNVRVECEKRIHVHYRDVIVGEFQADLVADSRVLVEIKAVRALTPAHEAQLVYYLTATGIEIGLLLNFGGERLEFKRKTRTYRPVGGMQNQHRNDRTG